MLVLNGCSSVDACIFKLKKRKLAVINPKKSLIHENTNAKITCDFADDRCRIATARLEKDIFVKTHLHMARIVV